MITLTSPDSMFYTDEYKDIRSDHHKWQTRIAQVTENALTPLGPLTEFETNFIEGTGVALRIGMTLTEQLADEIKLPEARDFFANLFTFLNTAFPATHTHVQGQAQIEEWIARHAHLGLAARLFQSCIIQDLFFLSLKPMMFDLLAERLVSWARDVSSANISHSLLLKHLYKRLLPEERLPASVAGTILDEAVEIIRSISLRHSDNPEILLMLKHAADFLLRMLDYENLYNANIDHL